jgi:DUF4097 and DUF4098 domain-containing protein YvlB
MVRKLLLPFSASVLSTLASSCVVSLGACDSDLVVDGVRLEYEHRETIQIPAWDAQGLAVESHIGDLRLDATHGEDSISVTLHEARPGDAHALYEGGRLRVHTRSGSPAAIGDVVVLTSAPLASLTLHTGMGDVRATGAAVQGAVSLMSGMGDVCATGLGEPTSVALETGMGDVSLTECKTGELQLASGMGDVDVSRVTATNAKAESGMGDVTFEDCSFDTVSGESGMGDVTAVRSTWRSEAFDSGLGDVRTR